MSRTIGATPGRVCGITNTRPLGRCYCAHARPQGGIPGASFVLARSGRVLVGGLVDAKAADRLVDGLEDERAILGEQVAINVLGRLDPAVPHLLSDLDVASSPSREHQ